MTSPRAVVTWTEGGAERSGTWLSPASPPPRRTGAAGDATRAAEALARVRRGETLVYAGDFRNARQLLAALSRRLGGDGRPAKDAAAAYRAERRHRAEEHDLLARLALPVEPGYRVGLPHAPAVADALAEALGPDPGLPGLLPLRDLLGMVGAHEWRRRGVPVAALGQSVHPHYGVYAPVRGEYVDLVAAACAAWPAAVAGRRALDAGTGTGVLACVLARAGARVVATDLEPRAVACARENAARLGLADRIEVVEADLFAGGPFDLAVSNPPWLPDAARTPLERAIYDPGGAFLSRFLLGLPAHLAPGGEAWLVLSDLAEHLGLRAPGRVPALAAEAGLRVADVREARPVHPRSRDASDPLHAARAAEVVRLYRLVRGGSG